MYEVPLMHSMNFSTLLVSHQGLDIVSHHIVPNLTLCPKLGGHTANLFQMGVEYNIGWHTSKFLLFYSRNYNKVPVNKGFLLYFIFRLKKLRSTSY